MPDATTSSLQRRCRSGLRRVAVPAGLLLAGAALAADQGELFERAQLFRRLDVDAGLAQSTVQALLQDRRGFVWIGTQGGLQRWDGSQWLSLQNEPGNPASLPENLVSTLCEQGERLWVGTLGGHLAYVDQRSGGVHRFRLGATAEHGVIEALDCDDQRVHVATRAGLYRIDGDEPIQRLHEGPIDAVAVDAAGRLWFATDRSLHALDPRDRPLGSWALPAPIRRLRADGVAGLLLACDGALLQLSGPDAQLEMLWPEPPASGGDVRDVQRAHDGALWLAVRERGLLRIEADGTERWLPPTPGIPGTLGEATLRSLLIDRNQRIWVGTDVAGVLHAGLEGAQLRWWVPAGIPLEQLGPLSLRAIVEDPENRLWLAGDHGQLWVFDLERRRWQTHGEALRAALGLSDASAPLQLFALAPAETPRLVLASSAGLVWIDSADASMQRVEIAAPWQDVAGRVRALLRDQRGDWWLAAFGLGVFRVEAGRFERAEAWIGYTPQAAAGRRIGSAHPLALYQDRAGRIWVGSLDGISRIEGGQSLVIPPRPDQPPGLPARIVRAFAEDPDGRLWIASHAGLLRLEHDADTATELSFRRVSTDRAAPTDLLYGLLADDRGQLWASGNRGLLRIDPANDQIQRYAASAGAPSPEFNGGAQWRLADGRLAFGNLRGLVVVDPTRSQPAPQPVALLLRGWSTAGHEQHLHDGRAPEQIRLPRAGLPLAIEFGALDPGGNGRELAWRLLGHVDDWQPADQTRVASWPRLRSGRYLFELRDNAQPERLLQVPILVPPPAWRHPLALGAAAGLVALLALLGWQQRQRRQLERAAQIEALRRSEDRLRWALWGSGDALWDWNLAQGSVHCSGPDAASDRALPGPWNTESVHPGDRDALLTALRRHLDQDSPHYEASYRVADAGGAWRWVLDRGRVVERDADGRPLRMTGTQRDVTQQQAADEQQRIAASVIDSMQEAVAVTDRELNFVSINPAFERITGYDWAEVAGRPASLLDSPLQDAAELERARSALAALGHWRGELWQRRRDGSDMLCSVELTAVVDPQGRSRHYVAVLSDITERRRTEQELRYLANYDMLTGLPNRILFAQRLQQALQDGAPLALLFFDLDHFKHVNDTMGHAAGDALLREVARRLRGQAQDGDLVARLGGDEFTLLVRRLGADPQATAVRRAEAVLESFREPIALLGAEVSVSPSVGLALYPEHGDSAELLLKHADTAMYAAKARGRNGWCLYSEALASAARQRVLLEAALRRALERDELRLVFQPQYRLPDLALSGFEALLRWNSPEHGEVDPALFIAIAEDCGLIGALGDWVLENACRQLATWHALGRRELRMAVNVSVLQLLRGDLPRRIAQILATHGLPAGALELELTESRLMANAEQAAGQLRTLKAGGLRLAIDDFGTGYSSLAYLKQLPIDALKVDRVFIADLADDPEDAAIVSTIIALAHAMGMDVVAEGVEQEAQLAFLRERGCNAVQGYLLSRPLEAADCTRVLERPSQPSRSAAG